MNSPYDITTPLPNTAADEPLIEVVIEVPRGGFVKRGAKGRIDFISPLPCPFNYGSVPAYVGLEGDLLDAVVLGPSLAAGSAVRVYAYGAVGMTDRGMYDDKLICARTPPNSQQRVAIMRFFRFYAFAKGVLNRLRGQSGKMACEGWGSALDAIARATPRRPTWRGPTVGF